MKRLEIYLKERLNNAIISGSDIIGEGEKKIVNHILTNNFSSVVIISPDADVILLSMIINNTKQIQLQPPRQSQQRAQQRPPQLHSLFNIYVLHYNQETIDYSYVDIHKFNEYLCKYMNIQNIIQGSCDFILICNIFGNDFLPKIPSINIKYDLYKILNLYEQMNMPLVNINYPNKYEININHLSVFLKLIADYETQLIQEKYFYDNYNIHKILNIIDIEHTYNNINLNSRILFYDFILKYVDTFGKIISNIISNNSNTYNVHKYATYLYYNQNNIVKQILFIENDKNKNYNNNNNKIKVINDLHTLLTNIKIEYESTGYIYEPLSTLKKNKDLITNFHKEKYINENKIIKTVENINDYDIELIKFEWKMGYYEKMLGATQDKWDKEFGSIKFDFNKNKIYEYPINKKKYYTSYFGFVDKKDFFKITNDYIYSLFWVFDFYFNGNSNTIWFYRHHRAPFISDIVYSLDYINKKDKINSIYQMINTNNNLYMTKYEHMLYVLPINKFNSTIQSELDTKTNKKWRTLLKYKNIFPDLDITIDNIFDNKISSIDCRRISFLAKCVMKHTSNANFFEFDNLIKSHGF